METNFFFSRDSEAAFDGRLVLDVRGDRDKWKQTFFV